MSDASKKMFKTLTPLALFVASQCSIANAAGTIQIVGPEGKDQTVSSQVVTPSQSTRTATVAPQNSVLEKQSSTAPTKVYGPTREDETLWSIASRVNPSNTTSVQQTLLAIYRLNPHAFENNNIHGLEPNSRLRLPTLEQVRRENTDDAKQLLLAHSKKSVIKKAPEAKVEHTAKIEKTEPKSTVAPIKTETKIQETKTVKNTVKSIEPVAESAPSVVALKSELETTEQEFTALQENNHQLRVRLAEVQHEVDNLKNELSDEDRIRNEVEKFINEQKQLALAEKKAEPSAMDNLASSPGLIALLALIPGALIAGLIAFFLSRRKKEEEEATESSSDTPLPSALAMPEDNFNMDDDIPEISLDDDDDILGDLSDDEFLFGNDDSDSNDDLFAEFETEKTDLEDDDPFASLDDDDLESMLSDDLDSLDDLDDDLDMSSSALTVDAEEKALGLEEMEKALNDFDSDLFSESDLETEDDDFDLSLIDDSDLSAFDKSTPELEENEDLEGGELDQSILDDLFSSMDDDEEESELDQGWDLDEKEETKLVAEPSSDSLEDELDFDTLLSDIEEKSEENSESINLDSDTEMFNELLDDSNDKDNISLNTEDDLDLDVNEGSTALLDDLLDESDDEDDLDLDIDEDSTSLLGELLGEEDELTDEDDIEIDEDSTSLLDEYLSEGDDDDDIKIDEDSTSLLDELIGDDSEEDDEALGKTGDDVDVEGVAASESLSEDTPRDEDWLVEAEDDELDDIPLFESELVSEPESSLDLDKPLEETELNELQAEEKIELEDDLLAEEAPLVVDTETETEADIEEDTESELDEDTDFSFDLDESLEATELNELQAKESIEIEDDLLAEEMLTEESLEESLVADTEAEAEEDVFANLEDHLEVDEVTTLSPGIEEDTESELDEATDFSFDLDQSIEVTELKELQSEEQIELEDDLLVEDVITENALEEETLALEGTSDIEDDLDENDFSLDDFLENSAVDFSQPNDDLDEDHLEGLSIEDALASLKDDSDDITPPESEIESLEQDIDATEDDKSEESLTAKDEKEVAPFDFHSRVSDEEKEALTHLDSAGLDIHSMIDDGASDWSGFNLDNTPSMDSEVEDEDWAEQPNFANDPHGDDRFLSIEALIAETENGDKSSVEEEDLNLDVGLDDFPDMLDNVGSHYVDVNSDAQSKLDLARAYIEMSDEKGALELLEEVLRSDDAQLKVEAEKLMKQLG